MPRRPPTAWLALPALVLAASAVFFAPREARAERVRDLVDVAGARDNQLVGYGIVTGLNGTGDDMSAPFAAQSTLSLLRRLGIQVDPKQLRLRNVAAVIVTANLPPFVRSGVKLDVSVSSIGNARSLSGGILVQTLLKGADQKTYAVAQGGMLVGGFEARGASGSSTKSGTTTSGRIPEGGIVEREVPTAIVNDGALRLQLRTPSFSLASRIAQAIDGSIGEGSTKVEDGGSVRVTLPAAFAKRPVELIAQLEELDVVVVRRARVVVNERTGTVVAGGDVRLSPAAVVHGGLTIVVKEAPQVSQPTAPFGQGTTRVVPRSDIQTSEGDKTVRYMPPAPTLADVAAALGTLGLSPRELTSVLQAMRSAGVLEAELVVQ
ncbi:MAG: flagellar basal body P-ring protein FlgI [Polyangiaceae bacterium]|jgi:flagellar P-ring protein precursor FlgI|nr:flagellar basal body P-ring protein FlgI [Polyangiaceae bacterium]